MPVTVRFQIECSDCSEHERMYVYGAVGGKVRRCGRAQRRDSEVGRCRRVRGAPALTRPGTAQSEDGEARALPMQRSSDKLWTLDVKVGACALLNRRANPAPGRAPTLPPRG